MMLTAQQFDTDPLPPREHGKAWSDWMSCLFFGLRSDLYGDTEFDGRLSCARAGEVLMTRLEANRHRVRRDGRPALGSEAAYLKIIAPWQGHAAVEQHGRQSWVRPGGWAIYDTTGGYEVANPVRSQHLIVMLPKNQLLERGLRLEPLMGRLVGGASGISRVALETMRNTYQELPRMSAEAARGAGELVLEMVRLSLQELAGRASSATLLQAFKDRIRNHVNQHLRDPALSVEQLAEALNCSKRHLHKAFEDEEVTLGLYILQRRLQACMRDLRDPACAGRSISDIAFSWGFNSGSHFSRVFREQAGLSPSEYRQQALAGAPVPGG